MIPVFSQPEMDLIIRIQKWARRRISRERLLGSLSSLVRRKQRFLGYVVAIQRKARWFLALPPQRDFRVPMAPPPTPANSVQECRLSPPIFQGSKEMELENESLFFRTHRDA